MRHFHLASLIIASAVSIGFAVPAQADNSRTIAQLHGQQQTQTARFACGRSFADAQCVDYQSRLLKAVAVKATASSKPVSVNDVSNRQLDALIASVN